MDSPKLHDMVNATFLRNRFSLTSGAITIPLQIKAKTIEILETVAADYLAGHYNEICRPRIYVRLNGELSEPFDFDELVARVSAWGSALKEGRLIASSLEIYDNWRNPESPEYDFFAHLAEQNPFLRIRDPLLHRERIPGYLHPFVDAKVEGQYLNLMG